MRIGGHLLSGYAALTRPMGLVPAWAVLLCLPLSGCFFWSGGGLEGTAYIHEDSPSMMFIEFRESNWRTGNLHMPFDFSVYETQTTYLLKGPMASLMNFGPGAELWRCGERVQDVSGSVRFERGQMVVDLRLGEAAQPLQLRQAFALRSASGSPRPCGHNVH